MTGKFGKLLWPADEKKFRLGWIYSQEAGITRHPVGYGIRHWRVQTASLKFSGLNEIYN